MTCWPFDEDVQHLRIPNSSQKNDFLYDLTIGENNNNNSNKKPIGRLYYNLL